MARPVMVRGSGGATLDGTFFFSFSSSRGSYLARAVPGLSLNRSRKRARPQSYDGALVLVCLWPYGIVWVIGYLASSKERQTRRLPRCSLRPSRFQNGLIMEVQNGAGSPAEHQYHYPPIHGQGRARRKGRCEFPFPQVSARLSLSRSSTYLAAWRLCATTCTAAHDGALAQRFLIVSLWRVLFSPR